MYVFVQILSTMNRLDPILYRTLLLQFLRLTPPPTLGYDQITKTIALFI